MKIFKHKGKVIGILIDKISKGSIPVTDEREPLQLVTLKHPKKTYLKAHMHAPRKRTTSGLQECLIPVKGSVKVDLYGVDKKYFATCKIKVGQVFILMRGGYGIHILEDAELIEVKNGPFLEDKVLL